MATDCFMKFTGGEKPIKGECTDTGHPGASGWIEINGFNLGVTNAATIGSAKGGAGAGRADFSSLSITKVMDNASPNLFYVMCHGDHFTQLDIEMLKAGGKTPVVYLKYEFDTVFVSSYQVSGAGGAMPMESVTFEYAKVTKTYTPQLSGGAKGTANPVSFDRTQNVVPGK